MSSLDSYMFTNSKYGCRENETNISEFDNVTWNEKREHFVPIAT